MNNFSTVHAIFAQIRSIGAAWRKKFKNLKEITQIRSTGNFLKNCPHWDFEPKHPVE
jgi:hypothetical protein